MKFPRAKYFIPEWKNALLTLASAGLLVLAFPDFEFWFLAWFALVPLMWAVERQLKCIAACFTLGWLFGTAYLFGTCWWLTYAPIHYAAIPWPIAYFLIFIACLGAGIFPGIFALILAVLIRRLGSWAFLAAPFVWVFSEFLRYWVTGNNWNAVGYSQAFNSWFGVLHSANLGGVYLSSFNLVWANSLFAAAIVVGLGISEKKMRVRGRLVLFDLSFYVAPVVTLLMWAADREFRKGVRRLKRSGQMSKLLPIPVLILAAFVFNLVFSTQEFDSEHYGLNKIIAIQPNVPMSGLDSRSLEVHRQKQIDQAEDEIKKLLSTNSERSTLVILPESPMNFMYNDDREFQQFIGDFARRNNVSVLFNSAEPDVGTTKYFNSAVMVGPEGQEVSQYDKIYLLPFGEAVPPPLETIVPGFVGNFAYGREYDLLPVGDAKAGVMICFESHFGQLSREYVRNGADVIIEMTNDGYLGPTPVLRQHLANAVFRAVETNRPVLRVTNVGITAYITENGQVLDAAPTYQEATRTWSVSKSDGSQTFYVKYGDWFAWLCTAITAMLLILCARKKPIND